VCIVVCSQHKEDAGVKRVYFVNAWVDVAMIGGLSILTLLLLRLLHGAERTPAIYTISTVLLWIGNWPHFSATNYRLYGQMAHLRQYPVTALVLPFVVLAGVAASFASPEVIAPLFIKVSCSGRRTTLVDNRWVLPCCMRAGGDCPSVRINASVWLALCLAASCIQRRSLKVVLPVGSFSAYPIPPLAFQPG
jgi:hypothetical protein